MIGFDASVSLASTGGLFAKPTLPASSSWARLSPQSILLVPVPPSSFHVHPRSHHLRNRRGLLPNVPRNLVVLADAPYSEYLSRGRVFSTINV